MTKLDMKLYMAQTDRSFTHHARANLVLICMLLIFRMNSNNIVNVKNVNLCLRFTVYSTSTYFRLLHIKTGVHYYLYNLIYSDMI